MLVLTTDGIRELSEGELDNVAGGGLLDGAVTYVSTYVSDVTSEVSTVENDVGTLLTSLHL